MKTWILMAACVLSAMALCASDFTENFEKNMPTSASSSTQKVSLPSGEWTLSAVYGYTLNGNKVARMNASGATMTTPPISRPSMLSFSHKSSGNYKDLYVEKSHDAGATWQLLQTFKSGSGNFVQASVDLDADNQEQVLIRFRCAAATVYIDNVLVSYSTMASQPSQQASMRLAYDADSLPMLAADHMTLCMEKGDGDGRLVLCSRAAASTWEPKDGDSYSGTFPKLIDDCLSIIASDNRDSIQLKGLIAGENYYLTVFEYNGEGADRNYLTPGFTLSQKTLEQASLNVSKTNIDFKNTEVKSSKTESFVLRARFLEDVDQVQCRLNTSAFSVQNSSFSVDTAFFEQTIYVRFQPQDYGYYCDTLFIQAGHVSCYVVLEGMGAEKSNHNYFIAPNGSDTQGDGSIDAPWYNLQKAVDAALPGDVIYCRGGEYFPDMMKDGSKTTIRITTSGTADDYITIRAYEDEMPVMNFKSQQARLAGERGLLLTGNYWHIYGIHFTRAGDNAIKLEGSYNIIQACTFSYNFDTGLQLGFGHDFSASGHGSSNDGSWCAYNDIIDCDSYRNCDYDTNYGSDADGFACKMHNGKGNRFIRCRAWENSDDAWDLYETDYAVVLIECWAWRSGKAEDHTWVKDVVEVSHGFSGNGNAIKMGGNGSGGSSKGKHEAWRCVAFNCDKSGSVKGFDQNSHAGGEKLVHCLAFGNGYDFMFERASANSEYYNNVCLGRQEIAGGKESHNAIATPTDKGWSNHLVSGVSAADYISLSEEDAKAPRLADGSLPRRFARLKSGSALVDAGVYVNMPYAEEFPYVQPMYYGSAPDIGPYELEEGELLSKPQLLFDATAKDDFSFSYSSKSQQLHWQVSTTQSAALSLYIYDMQGRCLGKLYEWQAVASSQYDIPIDVSSLPAGTYLLALHGLNKTNSLRFVKY